MKKILLFSAFLLVSVWMIAQNAKLSKADFEFLASGVPSEQGEVAIRTVEVYKITYESAVPKDYEKDVKKHLALLNKMGTNVTHKLINREKPYQKDYGNYRVLYEDEYRYTPNKSSALYQAFEPLLKEKYQEEIALLRTGEKRKDGSYHLALRNAPFMGYSNDTPSRMKNRTKLAAGEDMVRRHGVLISSDDETRHDTGSPRIRFTNHFYYWLPDDASVSASLGGNSNAGKAYLWVVTGNHGYDPGVFKLYDLHSWTGGVKDGMIDGEGEGTYVEGDAICSMKGRFNAGRPEGEFTYTRQTNRYDNWTGQKIVRKGKVFVHPFSDGLARVQTNAEEYWGTDYRHTYFIDENYNIVFNPEKLNSIARQWSDFVGGYAIASSINIATRDNLQFKVDKNLRVVDLSDQCLDSLSRIVNEDIPKLHNLFTVQNIQAWKFNINKIERDRHAYANYARFEFSEQEREKMGNPNFEWKKQHPALAKKFDYYMMLFSTMENWPRYPYHTNFDKMVNYIVERNTKVRELWDNTMKNYNKPMRDLLKHPMFKPKDPRSISAMQNKLAAMEREYEKAYAVAEPQFKARWSASEAAKRAEDNKRADIANNAAVNWDRCTWPSGKKKSSLTGDYWFENNEGTIVFKDGHIPTIRYSVGLDRDGKINEYKSSGGTFRTMDDMINYHLKRYKEQDW